MLNIFKLLLPAIVPSWRFFDIIAPSPRIEYSLLTTRTAPSSEDRSWQEFRPRPMHLSFFKMLGHMFWNPWRNESLFLVSCAERILQHPTQHSEDEILKRIMRDLMEGGDALAEPLTTHVQFRILLVQRKGSQLQQKIVFHSRVEALPAQGVE